VALRKGLYVGILPSAASALLVLFAPRPRIIAGLLLAALAGFVKSSAT
jgi:hypothetical protein